MMTAARSEARTKRRVLRDSRVNPVLSILVLKALVTKDKETWVILDKEVCLSLTNSSLLLRESILLKEDYHTVWPRARDLKVLTQMLRWVIQI